MTHKKVETPKPYLLQVLKELDSLCKDSSLTPEALKAVATRLFRHSQHLLDEFLMLGKARRNRKNFYDCKKHVAILGCLSRILIFIHPRSQISDPRSRIPDPGSRIQDPGSNNSTKRGGGKNLCPTIFCNHKYLIIVNIYIFEQVKKFL